MLWSVYSDAEIQLKLENFFVVVVVVVELPIENNADEFFISVGLKLLWLLKKIQENATGRVSSTFSLPSHCPKKIKVPRVGRSVLILNIVN